MQNDQKVAILMSVRDEESYIDFNISYHLNLGFDYIFIANHCSTDGTKGILNLYKDNPKVIVIEENDPVFDHAIIQKKILDHINANYKIDWFVFLDADEFMSVRDNSIHSFINRLEDNNIPYATVGWVNALFDNTLSDYRCSPVTSIDTTKFYFPWPERDWQEHGHFRKALVKNHQNMEIVVSGHYVKTENNLDFFGDYNWNPYIVPFHEAKLLHFEFRNNADAIYKKWEKMATYENDSTSKDDAPWLERIMTIREYVKKFKNNLDEINKRWFFEHRTFWGTIIPNDRIIYDTTLSIWYRKYFREKIESGKIKSVCLVRDRNLGDVIMTEPIARFLSKYVNKVCLATDISEIYSVINEYDEIYKYRDINSNKIDCEIKVKLVYELSDNKRSYIQGYMESIGFDEVVNNNIPIINKDWEDVVGEDYILIAPFTSDWEAKKRNWGYDKYTELKNLLESEYKIKCIMLEKSYSFKEMLSLVRHCKFFVGNDSGPAIIAQSFNKKSFIIFGATRPEYLILGENCFSIYDKNRHKLCKHHTRSEEIDCCEEFCMHRIRVNEVFGIIKNNI
ncbi:MAG: hypothetical protein AB201_02020 [Parcubacteria bacterium C7867-006]|nr:MAG: hypothetical protein AB201_02020 [Parcubacteria bacterium C7867-006]